MFRMISNMFLASILLLVVVLGWFAALTMPARADAEATQEQQQLLDVYLEFADAQNSRDLAAVGAFFVDGPEFLWVSDGQSYWGRDAVLARMGSFQKAEHWKVLPGIDAAEVVMLDDDAAMVHMPLTLEIGQATNPNSLRFLVSILFRRVEESWRIAALLTTNDKTPS